MSLPITLAVSFSNVLFRSSLNLMDRVLFSKKFLGFFHLVFISSCIPFLLGCLVLLHLGELGNLMTPFLTWSCFLISLATYLVGLSFSYALRLHPIKQVVLRAKIPELILPLFLLLPWYSDSAISFKTWIPLAITWIAIIPLLKRVQNFAFFFDKSTFLLVSTLILQMVVSAFVYNETQSYTQVFVFTVATLLWRCLFGFPMCFKQDSQTTVLMDKKAFLHFSGLLFSRSFCALVTQMTFMWCILEGQPLIFWPIINMTPLISSVASHCFLKEKIEAAEGCALLGFCIAATLPLFI